MNPITVDVALEGFRRMTRIRLFEERLEPMLRRGELYGAVHTSVGQEAAVVGALLAARPDDYMTGTHRSHGHPIGKGTPLRPLMAELMGRTTGVCRGKGGSMHLADFSVGSVGESGIVASAMPIACGAALTAKTLNNGRVCVCFFGDGASNEGAFHESVNLAAVWRLPVVFLCENNSYAITTHIANSMLISDISTRAVAYGIPGVTVDGQDFFSVYEAVSEAAARARRGDGPTIVEAKTYRFVEHSLGLQIKYREDAEIAEWRARDPITLLASRLSMDFGVAETRLEEIRQAENEGVEDAVVFARESPHPDPDDAFNGLYAKPFPMRFDDRIVGGTNHA